MRETGRGGVLAEVRKHLGMKPDLVLFRNQAGFIDRDEPCQFCKKRPLKKRGSERYGLAPGASDLIGIFRGRFVALEVKAPGKRPSSEQLKFLALVEKMGGFGDYCDSVDEAELCYQSWVRRTTLP